MEYKIIEIKDNIFTLLCEETKEVLNFEENEDIQDFNVGDTIFLEIEDSNDE